MPQRYRSIPPAVFLPPAAEEIPDLTFWTPSDKHCVLEFVPPNRRSLIDDERSVIRAHS